MLNLSINLPAHRLDLRLVKRRGAESGEPILPSLEDIRNTRSGSKASRFFRHVFEHKNIKKILGSNLAIVLVASSIIPASASASNFTSTPVDQEQIVIDTPKVQIETKAGIHHPLEVVKINQGYGFFHPGADFGAKMGAEITPMMSGTVVEAGWDRSGYGNKVIVRHDQNMETLYAHLSKITVKVGQEVQITTKIGEVGVTGHSTGPHLHFEVRENGVSVNPFSVLPKKN